MLDMHPSWTFMFVILVVLLVSHSDDDSKFVSSSM